MKKLTLAECPKTRADFVKKYNSDHVVRARAQFTGFSVLCGGAVVLPTGKVAGVKVK